MNNKLLAVGFWLFAVGMIEYVMDLFSSALSQLIQRNFPLGELLMAIGFLYILYFFLKAADRRLDE
ncbi:MAG: hypothetical protein INR69_03675 [Mucilaginibacter polytrichastri]|nr:hypothetical protein [Mucilaginibacter polytrichastri]